MEVLQTKDLVTLERFRKYFHKQIFGVLELNIINNFYSTEPFKTAITLRFITSITSVLWAGFLLVICLVIEGFFCRYLCPLGTALLVLGKFRILEFLKKEDRIEKIIV